MMEWTHRLRKLLFSTREYNAVARGQQVSLMVFYPLDMFLIPICQQKFISMMANQISSHSNRTQRVTFTCHAGTDACRPGAAVAFTRPNLHSINFCPVWLDNPNGNIPSFHDVPCVDREPFEKVDSRGKPIFKN